MNANEIRKSFLEFFKSKQHHIVPSAPVIPQDDPTLLFTNAGMNQFKDIFLGTRQKVHLRIANSQKCIRVSGKHNDLEEVGRDTYHHTFFEMLGNWSFGDYFKSEAIHWAWELLTKVWDLPKEQLWATIFAGDEADGVPPDEEAANEWQRQTDIAAKQILRFSKKDNFWEMGDTGPCGPCSEIHFDRGPGFCDSKDLNHHCGVNSGCARYIELWNLVFIQYNRDEQGRLSPLPAKHVDTGAGFERLVSVMQDKHSNYDTDIFTPIISEIATLTNKIYGDGEMGVAFRVLCDHIRSLTFAIADGAIPGNESRGYVLRRILRRAARFGRVLSMHEPFIYKLVAPLVLSMGDAYPEIRERQAHIERVIRAEEESFGRTLDRGIEIFEEKAQKIISAGSNLLPGKDAFLLHDTYGFPLDLTQLMAKEKQLLVDETAFEEQMKAQRERSSRAREVNYQTLDIVSLEGRTSKFVGYHLDKITTTVLHFDNGRLVLAETPFYAESGGQVGDTGLIENESFRFAVTSTHYVGEHIVHSGTMVTGKLPQTNDQVVASINVTERRAAERNHTVTHLAHRALRSVLGEHVHQAGSLVTPDYMRFDFTHFEKVNDQQLEKVQKIITEKILENVAVTWKIVTFEKAKEQGAMALFGEKYGDQVRMVEADGFSRELCGGTHVKATGEIGLFIITGEMAVAAGIRRIEGITGIHALDYYLQKAQTLESSANALGCRAEEVPERIEKILLEHKNLETEIRKFRQSSSKDMIKDILKSMKAIDGINIATAKVDVSNLDELKQWGDLLRDGLGSGVGVLAAILGEKANFICVVTKDVLETKRIKAGDIVKQVAAIAGGSGGGAAHMALAGAKDVDKVDAALLKVEEIVRSALP